MIVLPVGTLNAMEISYATLSKHSDSISVIELKTLLHELKGSRTDVCIRLRLLGQMWHPNFLKVFIVTGNGAVLIDQITNTTEIVSNLSDIVQFELDSRYHHFQPFYHYSVDFSTL